MYLKKGGFGTYFMNNVLFCWQFSSSKKELEYNYLSDLDDIYEPDHTYVGTNRVQRPESVRPSFSSDKPYDSYHYSNKTGGTRSGKFGKESLVSPYF